MLHDSITRWSVTQPSLFSCCFGYVKGLAIDEASNGVRVNVVSPGNIWTPLWKSWSDGEVDPTVIATGAMFGRLSGVALASFPFGCRSDAFMGVRVWRVWCGASPSLHDVCVMFEQAAAEAGDRVQVQGLLHSVAPTCCPMPSALCKSHAPFVLHSVDIKCRSFCYLLSLWTWPKAHRTGILLLYILTWSCSGGLMQFVCVAMSCQVARGR